MDTLTKLKRKYGTYINVIPEKSLKQNIFERDKFYKYLFIIESKQPNYKVMILASSLKKAKNTIKRHNSNYKYKITKYNEQAKLTTKAKISFIDSILRKRTQTIN